MESYIKRVGFKERSINNIIYLDPDQIDSYAPFAKPMENLNSKSERWCELYLRGGKRLAVDDSYSVVIRKINR